MSLLENLVTQMVKNSLGNQSQSQSQAGGAGGLGDLLGSVLSGANQSNQSQSQGGLGGLLGQVAGQLGGSSAQTSGLGSVLGGLLGGQSGGNQGMGATDLGNVLGSLLNQKQGGGFNKSTLLIALLPIVLGYIQKNGGLSGVLAKFNSNGLGNQAQSWMSVDANNDGIDAADVQRLFGNDEIDTICQQTGASQEDVCQGIAELLPQVVNDLTPHGSVEADESQANQEISELLKQLGK